MLVVGNKVWSRGLFADGPYQPRDIRFCPVAVTCFSWPPSGRCGKTGDDHTQPAPPSSAQRLSLPGARPPPDDTPIMSAAEMARPRQQGIEELAGPPRHGGRRLPPQTVTQVTRLLSRQILGHRPVRGCPNKEYCQCNDRKEVILAAWLARVWRGPFPTGESVTAVGPWSRDLATGLAASGPVLSLQIGFTR